MRAASRSRLLVVGLAVMVGLAVLVMGLPGAREPRHVSADDSPTVIDTIRTGAGGSMPENIAVNPNTNQVYVANFGSGTVCVVDGATGAVTDTIGVGKQPSDIAVNPMTNRIISLPIGRTTLTPSSRCQRHDARDYWNGESIRGGREPQHEPHLHSGY